MKDDVQRLSLDEFMEQPLPGNIHELLGHFNGGSFMECHQKVFEATGIWVDELVPVFQRFDAMVVTRDVRPEAVR
ncbi:hypothetical protein [Rhodococcus sp. T7]|uniref:hypothetical protein n=1 Tax=Rhodococcus sp. T7 TaxID=627444 RepID=UPI001357AF5C|nr:hypothetical protein [Rhodococcus sp. T7]KAF0957338.1 hypothetical protein MLGJGCBP_09169 [Rhodococcus sp. T7]KAF0966742.1 hypothetical protein MLGJGCBP_00116 [Rhodococcus sp. T7]